MNAPANADQPAHVLQQALVDKLRQQGVIRSALIEDAFLRVPRHLFLPNQPLEKVYSDVAIVVKRGEEGRWTSSSSQPAMMAIMLEQLDLRPGQRVLEIGTGTGFNAALMAEIVGPQGRVTTVDIQPDLVEEARRRLNEAGINRVETVAADGGYGHPPGAPYDRIILTVGSWAITPAWREQLVEGGRLVLPLNLDGPQVSVAFERQGDALVSRSVTGCGFMQLQGAFAAPEPTTIHIGGDQRHTLESPRPLPVPNAAFGPLEQAAALWLAQPGPLVSTEVEASLGEILLWLQAWLVLRERGLANLSVTGELVEAPLAPRLMGLGEEWKLRSTLVLVERDGMAALARPPGQPAPLADPNQLFSEPARIEIHVQQYGPGLEAARRLAAAVQAWDQAGKPPVDRLRMRAVPAGQPVHLLEGEILLDRPWTRLILWYDA